MGFSPGSTSPFGRARTALGFRRITFVWSVASRLASPGGSMAAIHQAAFRLRITTPPADISRTIACHLAETRGLVTTSLRFRSPDPLKVIQSPPALSNRRWHDRALQLNTCLWHLKESRVEVRVEPVNAWYARQWGWR